MVQGLLRGADRYGTGDNVQSRLRNVLDHLIRVAERVTTCRSLLENALTVHPSLVSLEQNEAMRRMSSTSLAQGEEGRRLTQETIEQGKEVKKISSWAAILFTPTLVASVYGMNFDHVSELHWAWGYLFAVALMFGLGVGLWGVFKHNAGLDPGPVSPQRGGAPSRHSGFISAPTRVQLPDPHKTDGSSPTARRDRRAAQGEGPVASEWEREWE